MEETGVDYGSPDTPKKFRLARLNRQEGDGRVRSRTESLSASITSIFAPSPGAILSVATWSSARPPRGSTGLVQHSAVAFLSDPTSIYNSDYHKGNDHPIASLSSVLSIVSGVRRADSGRYKWNVVIESVLEYSRARSDPLYKTDGAVGKDFTHCANTVAPHRIIVQPAPA